MNHRNLYHRFAGLVPIFVMLAQASIIRQPGKCSLDYPTLRQELEALDVVIPFHDLQDPPTQGADPSDQLSGVTTVSPNSFQPGPRPQELRLGENQFRTVPVLDLRWVNDNGQQQPEGVDQDVPL